MEYQDAFLIDMYKTMLRIREFDLGAREEYRGNNAFGFIHLYVGEEACAAGVCADLRPDDYITSTHRGHGHCIAKGCDVRLMMAELFGKANGYCKGKGGSMHIADFSRGIIGANGIVGAGIPIATGVGLTIKLKGTDQVCVCFFGDGASNQGTFHEALNLASLWQLPVIFVCENNCYGVSVSQKRHQPIEDISIRASAYNIPGITVDGNDALAVYETAKDAINLARRGGGPTLIECKTYRWYGHCEADADVAYRSKEEIDEWKAKCPLKRFREKLVKLDIVTEDEVGMIEKAVKDEIAEAIAFAAASPEPTCESALEDVYA